MFGRKSVMVFNLGRKEQAVILIILAVVLFTVGYRFASKAEAPVELVDGSNDPSEQKENGPTVHIVGAVEKPGVYKLPQGSRVNDALTQAGPLPEADLASLNLAAALKDGQKLVVSSQAEDITTPEAAGVQATPGAPSAKTKGLININTATEAELDSLPGIGPTLAARIVQHRQANGAFQDIEELKNVSGIGDKKYEDLQHLITVQ